MFEYLYQENLISNRVNLVSLGGNNDVGENFGEFNDYRDRNLIIDRINASGVEFLYEKNFDKNVEKRLNLISNNTSKVKLFINIGGNTVGIGVNENANYQDNGILYASKYKNVTLSKKGEGLVEKFLSKGVDAIQMLNLKSIALDYGLTYGFNKLPTIGEGDCYYDVSYGLTYPIIAISAVLVCLIYYKKKKLSKEI